jgi:hypothetical protein
MPAAECGRTPRDRSCGEDEDTACDGPREVRCWNSAKPFLEVKSGTISTGVGSRRKKSSRSCGPRAATSRAVGDRG